MRQLTIAPIVPIEMDHPSTKWQHPEHFPVKLHPNFRGKIGEHICFEGISGEVEAMLCFIWEYQRTIHYLRLDNVTDGVVGKESFLFQQSSFPKKSYLSHSKQIRAKFVATQTALMNEKYNLFSPADDKIALTIHLNPNLGVTKLVELVKSQWKSLGQELSKKAISQKGKGHVIPGPKRVHMIKHWKKSLRLLGCYRLNQCVGLNWANTRKEYGLKDNASEQRFRSDCREKLSELPLA